MDEGIHCSCRLGIQPKIQFKCQGEENILFVKSNFIKIFQSFRIHVRHLNLKNLIWIINSDAVGMQANICMSSLEHLSLYEMPSEQCLSVRALTALSLCLLLFFVSF